MIDLNETIERIHAELKDRLFDELFALQTGDECPRERGQIVERWQNDVAQHHDCAVQVPATEPLPRQQPDFFGWSLMALLIGLAAISFYQCCRWPLDFDVWGSNRPGHRRQ